ncbi:MAG TPA: ABC transporter substrate-binding protein [Candidatus Binatia bacterium]|jgi:NitT/TauT family transport system substrate-binding protein|nr:ABC transporter substrate-binding protein [Candidatus Binatia bacterium]
MKKISILLFVVSLVLCGYSKSLAQDKIVLPVTYSATNANMLSLWVAKDAGYFDEQGLDVRMLLIRGGSLAVQLLVTGQSPIGLIGGTSAAYAYMQGNKDVVVISRLQNVMAYTLGAKPEIQKPEDIKGKKLAVSRFGSTSDFVAEYALKHLGLKKTDVTMIQIGLESDRLIAMQRGDISLSVFSPIITPVVKKAGMRILLDLEELKVPYLLTGHGTTRTFLEKNRSVVVKFMKASILAIKRIKNDQPFAEKVLAKYVRTSDIESVRTALEHQAKILPDIPYPLEDGIKTILEDLARSSPEARNIVPSALIDTSVVRDAAKGL